MILNSNPATTRKRHHVILGKTFIIASILGTNGPQPFAAATVFDTEANTEDGEGEGVRGEKPSQLLRDHLLRGGVVFSPQGLFSPVT